MFKKLTVAFGKPICVVLYAAFSALLVKEIWIPFAALALMHFCEFIVIGYKVGKSNNLGFFTSFVNCLCFGFTWWLPIKK